MGIKGTYHVECEQICPGLVGENGIRADVQDHDGLNPTRCGLEDRCLGAVHIDLHRHVGVQQIDLM